MAVPQTSRLSTILSAFISGVVVPVLVQALSDGHKAPEPTPPAAQPRPESVPAPVLSPELRVVAQGVGRTPEEAWYEAVRNAERLAAASMVDGQTWSQASSHICGLILNDERNVVARCEDVRCLPDGTGWRREVAVFVCRATLCDRLKAAHLRVVTDAP